MLRYEKSETVAVVFQNGTKLLVPPFEVPTKSRLAGETAEETAYTLSRMVGIEGAVSYSLQTDPLRGEPNRAFLMTASRGELDDSDFIVPALDVESTIREHAYLSGVDKALIRAALRRLEYSSL